MSHFHIHRNIVDLLTLLSDSVAGGVAEEYGNKLVERQALHSHVEESEKRGSSYTENTIQIGEYDLIKKLTENHPSPHELLERYKELKDNPSQNLDLDAVLYLLSKIAGDDKLKYFLAKHAQQKQRQGAEGAASSTNEISNDDVAQIRSSIQEETAKRGAESTYKSKLFVKTRSVNRSLPELSQWLKNRPYLTLNYIFNDFETIEINPVLGALPLSSQEHALIGDLLHCLGGNSGTHIALQKGENSWSQLKFKIDESIDPAFKNLVERILPLSSNFSIITKFVEDSSLFSAGQVKQALASALWVLIKDYMFLVAQLDHQYRQGGLSLQKLLYFIQPTSRTLEILSSIIAYITKENLVAADVLSLLHEKTSLLLSDKKTQELTLYLTQAACTPYFENLERWIYKGIISDPFHEFLVEDNLVDLKVQPAAYCDGFWEKRYTICKKRIPVFLEKLDSMILHTGKYLNVIQQCNQTVVCPNAEEIVYTLDETQYVEKIKQSFTFASKKLVDLLMEEMDLMGRLRSVKHYFLLDQGDFILQFMDLADEELRKNIDDIVPTRLDHLLQLSLGISVAKADPYKDDVKILLHTEDLMSQISKIVSISTGINETEGVGPTECLLTGIESFSFNYEVKWPLSLILSPTALSKYQMLFRQLFHLKHVERVLGNAWLSNKEAKSFSLSSSLLYTPAFGLRQRMLNFVQHLEYYMKLEVIEPAWHVFINKLHSVYKPESNAKPGNVDDVLHCHADFLNNCLRDCMLTNPELLQIVYKLMGISTDFAKFILATSKYAFDAEMSSMIDSTQTLSIEMQDSQEGIELTGENFEQTIQNFDMEFTKHLTILLNKIFEIGKSSSNENLVNILYRINFNGFYSERLEKHRQNLMEFSCGSGKKKPPVPPKSPKVVKMRSGS